MLVVNTVMVKRMMMLMIRKIQDKPTIALLVDAE